jgi:hypothetical protein
MDASNNYRFSFFPLISYAFIVVAPVSDLDLMLRLYSCKFCYSFRCLFGIGNSIRKILLHVVYVCIAFSLMG